jgi:hypothetical protein
MMIDPAVTVEDAGIDDAEMAEFFAKFSDEQRADPLWDRTSILLIATGCALFAGGAAGIIARHIF